MRTMSIALSLCLAGQVAAAQMTTTYTGTQREAGKTIPATAQYSVENGRVAMILKGTHSVRILFDLEAEVLHMVNDDERTYFDITKANATAGDPLGMMPEMQKQLASLPADQRAMAEQAMRSAMAGRGGGGSPPPPLVYVWSKERKTVAGYECTRVDGMRGDDKVTEYCGSTSDDFRMSNAERRTMLEMQNYLRNFGISVRAGDETRAFQWDTKTDGYPVITRCFRNGVMTLDLALTTVDRTRLSDELFAIPAGYRKMSMGQ